MIGALPAFENRKDAEKYAKNNAIPSAKILEIKFK